MYIYSGFYHHFSERDKEIGPKLNCGWHFKLSGITSSGILSEKYV